MCEIRVLVAIVSTLPEPAHVALLSPKVGNMQRHYFFAASIIFMKCDPVCRQPFGNKNRSTIIVLSCVSHPIHMLFFAWNRNWYQTEIRGI